jgi:hypothetical protein
MADPSDARIHGGALDGILKLDRAAPTSTSREILALGWLGGSPLPESP